MKLEHDYYFVGNAHLDPVWMWRWQEGSMEAKSTIRSALDRMKEYPDFIFCCSAARVFEWIEEFDPDMFLEIKERIKEGRFIIVGGWYVQPDCNLPSGEGFARQGLYGQRYFMEKFGVTAKTGYNVDSFGHNAMLPQILKKQGLENYIFMRPKENEMHLPAHIFRWRSADGSEVIASRLVRHYATHADRENIDSIETFTEALGVQEDLTRDGQKPEFFFYGVGNHGGGPTKKNIEMIAEMAKHHPESKFTYSDTNDFFARVRAELLDSLPVWESDLQHHASGCYSAVSEIKNGIRRAECALISAEKFSFAVNALIGKKIPDAKVFESAWKNVLFCHFHDSFGGCSIKEVYEDAALMLGESRSVAARIENNALQTLSFKINTEKVEGDPIIVFNSHDFPVTHTVSVAQNTDHIYDANGNEIPSQIIHSPTSKCRRVQGDTTFNVTVPPLGYITYYKKRDNAAAPAEKHKEFETGLKSGENFLENNYLRVEFSGVTGYITRIFDKINSREVLSDGGAVPVVIDESEHDTWSHNMNYFDKEIGVFTKISSRVPESGPVIAKLEIVSGFGASKLTQVFSLDYQSKALACEAKIDWHEARKMLKLRFDVNAENPDAFYEIPYGVIKRPANGEEEPGLMWVSLKDENGGLAVINNNKYSYSAKASSLYLTAVRSPFYLDHGRDNGNDSRSELTDQGESEFSYMLLPLKNTENHEIIRLARAFNTPPTVIIESKHGGVAEPTAEVIKKNAENIIVSAIKRSEDGTGTVIRAYETDGKETDALISLGALPELKARFTPYSVNTYYLKDGADEWKEVLMTEM